MYCVKNKELLSFVLLENVINLQLFEKKVK